MPPALASSLFAIGILGLFVLDGNRKGHVSKALCLPLIWLFLASSRSLTEWLAGIGFGSAPPTDRAIAYAEGTPLDRNVLIGLMILAMFILVRRRVLGALVLENIPIVLLLCYSAVSIIWSDFPDIAMRRWFKAIGCLLLIAVVLSERDRDFAIRRLFVWSGFLLIPLSVLLIKYYPTIGKKMIIENISTWLLSPVGVTMHKNSLGGICQIYGLVFLWHFLSAYRDHQLPNRNRHLIAHGVGLSMVVWLFGEAHSVTAQSSFILGATLLIAIGTQVVYRRRWLVHLLFACLIAIPFATLFLGLGDIILPSMGRDSSLTGRTDIWRLVISLVDVPLIGTGFESFWLGDRLQTMRNYQLSLNEAHNGFIEFYLSLGWIGLFLLGLLIFRGYTTIVNSYRENPSMCGLRLTLFLAVIVSSFTEATFRSDSVFWLVFLVITMNSAKAPLLNGMKTPLRVGQPSMRPQFGSVALTSDTR